jgi:exonuclease III
VAVAAKLPFTKLPHPSDGLLGWECRWLECRFSRFCLIAVYFPGDKPKLKYWKWFLPLANSRADTPCIFVGDFNTGKHYIDEEGATFYGQEYMTEMESRGWVDAWRHHHFEKREYTWCSSRGGQFRLDYVWLSKRLAMGLKHAAHDHGPRSSGITDHSALLVEFHQQPNGA